VMPCHNEADMLETCITKAQRTLRDYNIIGKVSVADNGSTDGSQSIVTPMGACVIHVEAKVTATLLCELFQAPVENS